MYIEAICLFLKEYLDGEEFEKIVYSELDDLEKNLEKELFFKIITTDYRSKKDLWSLKHTLSDYVRSEYRDIFDNVDDRYVEKIIESNNNDDVTLFLKKKYEKPEIINIDCSCINNSRELFAALKNKLSFPKWCGENWDAVNDLFFEIILPKKLVFDHWCDLEMKLPADADMLKSILIDIDISYCKVIFE